MPSGRYPAQVFDFLIQGEVWTYVEGAGYSPVHRDAIDHFVQDDWETCCAKRMPVAARASRFGLVSRW